MSKDGNTYLSESQLRERAAERGWILSEPGEQAEVNVYWPSKFEMWAESEGYA